MISDSSSSDSRVSAPMARTPSASRMYVRPGMPLMSTTCDGLERRSFISGMRLCPPERILASSPSLASSAVASSREAGAWYSNAAGIMAVVLSAGARRKVPCVGRTLIGSPDRVKVQDLVDAKRLSDDPAPRQGADGRSGWRATKEAAHAISPRKLVAGHGNARRSCLRTGVGGGSGDRPDAPQSRGQGLDHQRRQPHQPALLD